MTYTRSTLKGAARLKSEGLTTDEIFACVVGRRYYEQARFRMMYARWNRNNKSARSIPVVIYDVEIYDPADECWWDC